MKIKEPLDRLILSFGFAKLVFHFFTNTNYDLHRDEYLYFDQGNHLGWGFMEVPPLTPLIGKLAGWLGGNVFAIRLFPALVGVATIIVAGLLVKKLGGKRWAIIFTCGGLLLSPAILASNSLFQPVSFNQFFWFLSAYLLLQAIQTQQPKFWYFLGISIGLGFLTKYSIVFYGVSLGVGLLLTPQRKVLTTKYPYLALLIALLLASPNLYWQYEHNLPVMEHMRELSESQLVHMDWGVYLKSQLNFHYAFSIIWLAGLIGLFRLEILKSYRLFGLGFIFTIVLIGALSGKSYYTIGAFTMLFPFGGVALERWIERPIFRWVTIIGMSILSLPNILFATPILKINQMKKYCAYMAENFGITHPLRWEDGEYYDLPQDFADMNGWEELAEKVAKIYHGLPTEERKKCMIYGGSYGHASSLNYFRKKYNLPTIHSFNSSYLMWVPDEVDFDRQIMVEEEVVRESSWFNNIILQDSIENPFARDAGYIHYRTDPKVDVSERWKEITKEAKAEFNF